MSARDRGSESRRIEAEIERVEVEMSIVEPAYRARNFVASLRYHTLKNERERLYDALAAREKDGTP